jgi:hypothetical protein
MNAVIPQKKKNVVKDATINFLFKDEKKIGIANVATNNSKETQKQDL